MLGSDDWTQLATDYTASAGIMQRVVAAALDLEDRLAAVELSGLASMIEHKTFDARLAALKAAREHVSALPSEQQNQRGYRDHALTPRDRINLEMQVAHYLLGDRE